MPFEYDASGGYYCGPDIASAVNISLEDGDYTEYFEGYYPETEAWKAKSVKSWTGNDIVHWISSVAREMSVCPTDIMGEKFGSLDGYQLSSLSSSDFEWRDRTYGTILHKRLQQLLDKEGRAFPAEALRACHLGEELPRGEDHVLTRLEATPCKVEASPPASPDPPPPIKKARGRPRLPRRKKKTEKLGRLWEFLRDLLKNPEYCPSLIVWENYEEGMFRFVHSDKVAKLWGSKKENPDMNYEKLSRAMRYYYKSQVLMPVYGRRLVYKFGPTATGWRVDNPNFAK